MPKDISAAPEEEIEIDPEAIEEDAEEIEIDDEPGLSPESEDGELPEDGDEPASQEDADDDSPGEADDEGAADEPTDEDPAAEAARPEADAAPAAAPFTFKVDKKEVEVPGAVVTKVPGADGSEQDYLVMPMADFDRVVRPHLADRGTMGNKITELRREVAARDPEHNQDVIFARQLTEDLKKRILSDEDGWEDKLLEYAAELRKEWPVLEKDAEIQALRSQDKVRRETFSEEEQALQAEQFEQSLEAAFQGAVTQMAGADEKYKDLDLESVMEDLARDVGTNLFFQAKEGQRTEDGQLLSAGEWYVDLGRIEDKLEREARRAGARRERQKAAQAAKGRNDAALGKGRKNVPPAVPAKGQPASGGEEAKAYGSREEWEADLDNAIAAGRAR